MAAKCDRRSELIASSPIYFRYVQKRRMWEEQERQRRLDDERHEQRLRERYLKVWLCKQR